MAGNTSIRGSAPPDGRALAPDLARGFMLLFIALANTVWYLWAVPDSGVTVHPAPEGVLDTATQFFTVLAVDMRSYPMFAFLFGYGMVQLARRQQATGASVEETNALLRRRNLWLIVFGFFHALLLWMGDILAAYGLAGLFLGWLFLWRRDLTSLVWGLVLTGLIGLLAVFGLLALPFLAGVSVDDGGFGTGELAANLEETSVVAAALGRISTWPLIVIGQGLFGLAVPAAILFGFWAAHRRFLEEPGRRLKALGWIAAVGVTVGWLGGLPLALQQVGVLGLDPMQAQMLTMPHMLTGLFCGLGYIALISLIAHRIQERGRASMVVSALSATGKRSLSAYLAQSVLCAPILAAWGLGLGAHLTSWSMFLFAIGVWLTTVLASYALERAGRRGPAEVLLRKCAYRRTDRPAVVSPREGAEPGSPREDH